MSTFLNIFNKKLEQNASKSMDKNELEMKQEEFLEDAIIPEEKPINVIDVTPISPDVAPVGSVVSIPQNTNMSMDRENALKAIDEYIKEKEQGKARKITEIAVHCTASKEGVNLTIDKIDSSHKARGFKKQAKSGRYCGYHYVIALDGTIMFGRCLSEIGAHVSGYNSNSIGISYVGGLDSNGKGKDTRTDLQKDTLIWLISTLKHKLGINKVQGHRDYSPDKNGDGKITKNEWIKECPCFDAIPEYEKL